MNIKIHPPLIRRSNWIIRMDQNASVSGGKILESLFRVEARIQRTDKKMNKRKKARTASGRLHLGRFFQTQFFDGLISHLVLLYLSAYRHGKFIDELYVSRNLEVRDFSFAEVLYLLL